MVQPIQLMIVGAQKSGTSSLAQYLAQHPNIFSHEQREFNYFVNEEQYAQGYEKIYPRYFPQYPIDSSILLAKSVGVLSRPKAIKRLWQHNSECQLIAILRNPVDRAYSAYWYIRRVGWEDITSFEEAIAAEPMRLQEDETSLKRQQCNYLERGLYYKQLTVLFEYFGRERVQVFLLEDLKQDPVGLCQKIYNLMGIDSDFLPQVNKQGNKAALPRFKSLSKFFYFDSPFKKAVRNLLPARVSDRLRSQIISLNEQTFVPPPMNPETRTYLQEYFLPHNAQLEELLGRDLSHWQRS